MDFVALACVIGLGVLVQFVAAILGPRVLFVASLLLILGAAGVAGYLAFGALGAQFAGPGMDMAEQATMFGAISVALIVTYFLMRSLFRCMARCSA